MAGPQELGDTSSELRFKCVCVLDDQTVFTLASLRQGYVGHNSYGPLAVCVTCRTLFGGSSVEVVSFLVHMTPV